MPTDIAASSTVSSPAMAQLPESAGDVLLPLARSAIAARLGAGSLTAVHEGWLSITGASFVTLKLHNNLRGCIGTLQAHRTLGEDVKANAMAAAFNDPRFKPLTQTEFEAINVEVSVLSPLEALTVLDENDALSQLRANIDGVVFVYGHHRSTFLPQVWEEFSDPHLFLGHLKYKAGLPPTFWDPAVKISRYTVSKWRE